MIALITKSKKPLKGVMNTSQLISVLNSHNLKPINVCLAEEIIKDNGYYYFTGYRRVFIDTYNTNSWSGKFDDKVIIENLYCLLEFDKKLSSIILKYLNIIERKLKVRSAYFLSVKFGEDFYFDSVYFKDARSHSDFLIDKYKGVLNTGLKSEDPIIKHHVYNYSAKLPTWVLFEHISFGAFIKILEWLKNQNKNLVFNDIFVSSRNTFNISEYLDQTQYTDMLNILCYYRNRIAHLGRLFDWKSNYNVDKSKVQSKYSHHFDITKNYYCFNDIKKIMGFFLSAEEHNEMSLLINILIGELRKQIPDPYFSRVISLMNN